MTASSTASKKLIEGMESMAYGPAPESAAAVNAWLESHQRRLGLFIDNRWVFPEGAASYPSINPATGQELAQTVQAGHDDVNRVVAAARAAQQAWSRTPGSVRARHLYAIARNLMRHARLLAVLESMDNGKPFRESRDIDVPLLARHFMYHAGWAQLMDSELSAYQSVGVVGQIIPWNFPLLMLAWKIAPAIALGNTVVLKPASHTRLSALLFAEIVAESGLPAGVVNIITGSSKAGSYLVAHEDVDKIAFTGSTDVGRTLRRQTAGSGKKLSLELGGKSPFIVFDDCDLHAAVEGVVDAIWFNQGQVCCAGSRLLVQENIAETFHDLLKQRMGRMRVGDPLDKCIDMGAIVDPSQMDSVQNWIAVGRSEGGTVFQPDIPLPAKGLFLRPTLITGCHPAATVVSEEIFGPVLVSMSFRSPAEALELANNTRYGLAASIWSENLSLALEVASKVKAGSVWINCTNQFDAAAGFGGYRESGYGREGGREGLFEYLRPAWQSRPRSSDRPDEPDGTWGEADWSAALPADPGNAPTPENLDRTAKLYIGGRQQRSDGQYVRAIYEPNGAWLGQVPEGNRKDIRDAVEAAHAAHLAKPGWSMRHGYNRSQILYFLAENLSARRSEFAERLRHSCGGTVETALREVETSIERLFYYAAWADKWGGEVQETTLRGVTLRVHEPLGVLGILCPEEYPLLGLVSLMAPAICRGNTLVIVPSQSHPLPATDFYQVLDTSDVPGGVVNIVTGQRDHLAQTLVRHEDVDGVWYFGSDRGSYHVEYLSAVNMKRTWTSCGKARDWLDPAQGQGEEFLREATQCKNIWVPSGA